MQKVYIDCELCKSKLEIHEYLKNVLCLPEHYGGNLAALHDCLTDICEETVLQIRKGEPAEGEVREHWQKIFRVLKDVADENPCFHMGV